MNFTQITVDWHNSTFFLYLCVIVGSYFITYKTQNQVIISITKKRRFGWEYIVPFILLFLKALGTTGRDLRSGYYYNFLSATSWGGFRDQTLEPGYRLLNVLVRNITASYPVFIFVVGCLTLYPVIKLLKKYKDEIDLPAAVLMYVSIFFFNSFSPLRMCLAASFGLFAYDAMLERKVGKALLWIMIASSFHTTALVLFIPYFATMARILSRKMIGLSLLVLFLLVYFGRGAITALLTGSERYYIYNSESNVHIGLEQFVYYLPLFFLYYLGRKESENKHFGFVAFVYLATAFCFGMLGYIVSIFGRFRDMFIPLIIIVPYYIKRTKKRYPNYSRAISLLFFLYCILRFVIFIVQYYNREDLMPYTNVFGWVI